MSIDSSLSPTPQPSQQCTQSQPSPSRSSDLSIHRRDLPLSKQISCNKRTTLGSNHVKTKHYVDGSPRSMDIPMGSKRKAFRNHPGTKRFLDIAQQYKSEYHATTIKTIKSTIIRKIVHETTRAGARFLKQEEVDSSNSDDGLWYIPSDSVIFDKVGHVLRYRPRPVSRASTSTSNSTSSSSSSLSSSSSSSSSFWMSLDEHHRANTLFSQQLKQNLERCAPPTVDDNKEEARSASDSSSMADQCSLRSPSPQGRIELQAEHRPTIEKSSSMLETYEPIPVRKSIAYASNDVEDFTSFAALGCIPWASLF